jgi:hypothetical protein
MKFSLDIFSKAVCLREFIEDLLGVVLDDAMAIVDVFWRTGSDTMYKWYGGSVLSQAQFYVSYIPQGLQSGYNKWIAIIEYKGGDN